MTGTNFVEKRRLFSTGAAREDEPHLAQLSLPEVIFFWSL
jgi:hypothetical protein